MNRMPNDEAELALGDLAQGKDSGDVVRALQLRQPVSDNGPPSGAIVRDLTLGTNAHLFINATVVVVAGSLKDHSPGASAPAPSLSSATRYMTAAHLDFS